MGSLTLTPAAEFDIKQCFETCMAWSSPGYELKQCIAKCQQSAEEESKDNQSREQ
jgi:hypothetical protein